MNKIKMAVTVGTQKISVRNNISGSNKKERLQHNMTNAVIL